MKTCPACKEEKPHEAFGTRKRDGHLRSHCRPCSAQKTREYYRRNAEKVKAATRTWRKAHPDVLSARKDKARLKNPERYREQRRAARARHKDKIREYMSRYRRENADRVRARMRERSREAKHLRAAYAAKQRRANPELFRAKRAAYYAQNREREFAQQADYRRRNPDKFQVLEATRRARKRNAAGKGVTANEWSTIKASSLGLCAYCNARRPLTMDHIDPLALDGEHDVENTAAACRSCNSSKSDTPLLVWLAKRAIARKAA